MSTTELWIDRTNFRKTKIVHTEPIPLNAGEIKVAIERFALTANNVSYALSGDMIGYWKFFPAQDHWGKVPVWGLADVIESNCPDIAVGERLYGYFPMSTHLVMQAGRVKPTGFTDMMPHRQSLPELYNHYSRTGAEPASFAALENERCLYFPLFITSFMIADYLEDNGFFNANQILIGSVSSKTGFGLAAFLKSVIDYKGQVVGLTSEPNKAFVDSLNCCDQIVCYGDEDQIDSQTPSIYVDMSGNTLLRKTLHTMLDAHMVSSISVGATHWEAMGQMENLPGARPEFFFAPAQIDKRNKDWGSGVIFQKAASASANLASQLAQTISFEFLSGSDAITVIWQELLDNKVSPDRGIIVSMTGFSG